MRYTTNPVENLASAVYSAVHSDLEGIEYDEPDYSQSTAQGGNIGNFKDLPKIKKHRRPSTYDVEVAAMFIQSWGSTALGFGGIGGASVSDAYTIVIHCRGEYAVYFGGRFAYRVRNPNSSFYDDLNSLRMSPVKGHTKYARNSTEEVVHD